MSLGDRLREERTRLGFSQTAFAALAGASKNSQANWEKGAAAPGAGTLTAFAEAGADVLYILTGRRGAADPETAIRSIEDDLAAIRRRLLDPSSDAKPGELAHITEQRVLGEALHLLKTYLHYDKGLMTDEQLEEAKNLLAIVSDPKEYAGYRSADLAQHRDMRARTKKSLVDWFDDGAPAEWYGPPREAPLNILVSLALEYGVPIKLLVELVAELRDDAAMRPRPEAE